MAVVIRNFYDSLVLLHLVKAFDILLAKFNPHSSPNYKHNLYSK